MRLQRYAAQSGNTRSLDRCQLVLRQVCRLEVMWHTAYVCGIAAHETSQEIS